MNKRELEQLERKSLYNLSVNDELKDQVINSYLSELNRIIKSNIKNKDLTILVIEKK